MHKIRDRTDVLFRCFEHIKKYVVFYTGLCIASFITSTAYGAAAGTAVTIASIDNLGATVKGLITGSGKLVIDAAILAAAGYGSVVTKSPAVIILGVVSVGLFHLALAVFL